MTAAVSRSGATVDSLRVDAFRIPTDRPESDGTLSWSSTTLVVVEVAAAGRRGLGYTYADVATAMLVQDTLREVVVGSDLALAGRIWARLVGTIRNLGRQGIAAMAISAVDNALWDLRARLCEMPLAVFLGMTRERVPVYGSGGFTSYTIAQLQEQLGGWAAAGIPRVKMKVGRDAGADVERVRAARNAIGPRTELFVDANGGYDRKQAVRMAAAFAELDVAWFEEPVYHLDFSGLRLVRDQAPPEMEISAGEYGYDPTYFKEMLAAGAVDVLQADATRCEGITGLLVADALCEAYLLPLSTHCAPALHAHPAAALKRLRHIEYFYDHVRIEHMLFDGVLKPVDGCLRPDLQRAGNGLEFKRQDAERYAV